MTEDKKPSWMIAAEQEGEWPPDMEENMNKYCPMLSHRRAGIKECEKNDCAWWEESREMCCIKSQARHLNAVSVGVTELGMALVDVLRADRKER